MALAPKDRVDADLELDVAVEDVERRRAEDDAVLGSTLLEDLPAVFQAEGIGAPLRVEGLRRIVQGSHVDGGADATGDAAWSMARHPDLWLRRHHPVVKFVVERVLLHLGGEHGHLARPQEAEHQAECLTVSVDEHSIVVHAESVSS